ncbi:MAG TPA: aminotransferase class I/II-fold pyridoxal phosphate-dependent enzyme [Candidatus Krumholzibacteria bacterium]|nr:aminotransferase class I/II-fold pyridoxal phosphate-dependent enzyme [Candidatus Krumholzibacteria bacterium]
MARLDRLPPYLFSAIDAAKAAARAAGRPVVDLGIGDPDRPTPAPLVEVMTRALAEPAGHRYPAQRGDAGLRRVIAAWLAERHGVEADPDREILALIGSKEGLGHLPLTCVEEGDNVLVPSIGYPVYGQATILAGGDPRVFDLAPGRGFVPDLAELDRLADDHTRMAFLNYPNNPTGAVVESGFWSEAAALAARRGFVLVNDAAYLEVTLDGGRPRSMLREVDHRTNRVIELHSLSKMFNMTGWRVGFAVGNADVVRALGRVKESIDSGVFTPVQKVAAHALGPAFAELQRDVMAPYAARRKVMVEALEAGGFAVFPSGATFYVWVRVPGGGSSAAFCTRVLEEIDVVVTPGLGFGPGGEGWFRISLTAADQDVAEGARRFRQWR